jgi:hypothetical protein
MALHRTIEEHDANPPESWQVVKVAPRTWHLRQADHKPGDGPLTSCETKARAEALKVSGFFVDLYEREGRWMRGEPVAGWKPYRSAVNA